MDLANVKNEVEYAATTFHCANSTAIGVISHCRALVAEVERLTAERDTLRSALITTGRNLGAALSDDVSSEFLALVSDEARVKVERLTEIMKGLLEVATENGADSRYGVCAEAAEAVRA